MTPTRRFLVAGLVTAALLAGVVSALASGSPDGLDATTLTGCTLDAGGEITGGSCVAMAARDEPDLNQPLAGYQTGGLADPHLSTGVAGLVGVILTFGVATGVFWLTRRRAAAVAPR